MENAMIHGGEIYDKKIDLDFSVSLNPNPAPAAVRKAVLNCVAGMDRYPDREQTAFREAVCHAENVLAGGDAVFTPENVFGGNGASELLAALVRMVAPKRALLFSPCFSGYEYALAMEDGCEIHYGQEPSALVPTMNFADRITEDTDLVILANPNNPTGKAPERAVLQEVILRCQKTGCALIIDECFFRLLAADKDADSGEALSARNFLFSCPGLYVVDAYTKLFSIPGVRVGFVLSSAANIERLRRFLPEWNMSVFAIQAGIACANELASGEFLRKSREMIREERAYLTAGLQELGIRVYPSDTGFLMIRASSDLYERLLRRGILIRDCSNFKGLEGGYFRIGLKDHPSNKILLEVLRDSP